MKITVKDPPEVVIGNGPHAFRRPYYSGGKLAVKITAPCEYCGNPVTFIRGAVFSGERHHTECWRNSGDAAKQYEAFKKSVLGSLTAEEYQAKHGVAWNE